MSTKLSPFLRKRLNELRIAHAETYLGAQQQFWAQDKSGGFPGGMVRVRCCRNLPDSATCGKVAATGFNDCLDDARQPLPVCFNKYVTYAGLRACNASHPCREDYICVRGALERGESAKNLQALVLHGRGRQAGARFLRRPGRKLARQDRARHLHPALLRAAIPRRQAQPPVGITLMVTCDYVSAVAKPAATRDSLRIASITWRCSA